MKRVGENYVTHHPAQIVVTEINRRIELKIARDVAGETMVDEFSEPLCQSTWSRHLSLKS